MLNCQSIKDARVATITSSVSKMFRFLVVSSFLLFFQIGVKGTQLFEESNIFELCNCSIAKQSIFKNTIEECKLKPKVDEYLVGYELFTINPHLNIEVVECAVKQLSRTCSNPFFGSSSCSAIIQTQEDTSVEQCKIFASTKRCFGINNIMKYIDETKMYIYEDYPSPGIPSVFTSPSFASVQTCALRYTTGVLNVDKKTVRINGVEYPMEKGYVSNHHFTYTWNEVEIDVMLKNANYHKQSVLSSNGHLSTQILNNRKIYVLRDLTLSRSYHLTRFSEMNDTFATLDDPEYRIKIKEPTSFSANFRNEMLNAEDVLTFLSKEGENMIGDSETILYNQLAEEINYMNCKINHNLWFSIENTVLKNPWAAATLASREKCYRLDLIEDVYQLTACMKQNVSIQVEKKGDCGSRAVVWKNGTKYGVDKFGFGIIPFDDTSCPPKAFNDAVMILGDHHYLKNGKLYKYNLKPISEFHSIDTVTLIEAAHSFILHNDDKFIDGDFFNYLFLGEHKTHLNALVENRDTEFKLKYVFYAIIAVALLIVLFCIVRLVKCLGLFDLCETCTCCTSNANVRSNSFTPLKVVTAREATPTPNALMEQAV